jgi:hypothetical protein
VQRVTQWPMKMTIAAQIVNVLPEPWATKLLRSVQFLHQMAQEKLRPGSASTREGFVCTKMGRKDDCCFGLTCDTSGKCVKDCTNVKCGRTGDKPCCPGSVCVNHHCTECPEDIGCSECPNGKGNSPLGSVVSMTKVCADVSDRVGQATCGDVTCNAICSLACGGPPKDGMKYAASNCNNARGGNCQGVQSTFTPFPDFKGGPCCGCNSCDQVPE